MQLSLRHWLWLPFALLFTACVDLGHVRSFADTSLESARLQGLVDDYVHAGERRELMTQGSLAADPAQLNQRKLQAEEVELLLAAMQEYLDALASLAGDEAVQVDPDHAQPAGTERVPRRDLFGRRSGDASLGFPNVTEAELGHAELLLDKLVTMMNSNWRQAEVRKLLDSGGAHFETAVSTLHGTVLPVFANELKRDLKVNDAYYAQALSDLEPLPDEFEAVFARAAWERHAEFARATQMRQKELAHYQAILQSIFEGHTALRQASKLDSAEVIAALRVESNRIQASRRTLERERSRRVR